MIPFTQYCNPLSSGYCNPRSSGYSVHVFKSWYLLKIIVLNKYGPTCICAPNSVIYFSLYLALEKLTLTNTLKPDMRAYDKLYLVYRPSLLYCGQSRSCNSRVDINGKAEAKNYSIFLFSCKIVVLQCFLLFSCCHGTLGGNS